MKAQLPPKWIPFFATQFLGVFNDNLLKGLICFLGVAHLSNPESASLVITIATALLVIPYVLFSPLAGRLSKTHSKLKILQWAKIAELPIMLLAVSGFYLENLPVLLVSLFLMGLQSALYSPSKMGLIRDIGQKEGLSFGTGTMEMMAFLGVLLGTSFAGLLGDLGNLQIPAIGISLVAISIFGIWSSKKIHARESKQEARGNQPLNPITFLAKSFNFSSKIKGLNLTILGLAGFWIVGSMIQMNLFLFAPEHFGLSDSETGGLMAFVALCIGLGSWFAGWVSNKRVELGLTPIGGLGMSLCLIRIAFFPLSLQAFLLFLGGAAFFAGVFKVPLNAWIQDRVKGRKLGDVLAYSNQVVFIALLLSAGLFGFFENHFGSLFIFQFTAVLAAFIFLITLLQVPAMLVRFIFFVLAHTIYRIRVRGNKHIPTQGGALLVANHLSFMDSLLVVATVPRMVRFVLDKRLYEHPLMHWFCSRLNMIPVQASHDRSMLDAFNKTCQDEINKGHVVCIFAEGQVSRNGNLLGFKKGVEHIAKGIDAPIIPLNMDNVVGSPLSFPMGKKRAVKLGFSSLRKRITLSFGQPLPPETPAFRIRQRVAELGADAFAMRIKDRSNLAVAFLKNASKNGRLLFAADQDQSLSFGEARKKVLDLGLYWKKHFDLTASIGILLPKSVDGLLTNISLTCAGKTVINLPSEAQPVLWEETLQRCNLTVIISSKQMDLPPQLLENCVVHFLEDILETISQQSKLKRMALGWLPAPLCFSFLSHGKPFKKRPAAIVLRTDITGADQFIALSHENVLSNIASLRQIYGINKTDRLFGILDPEGSYSYLFDTWLPAIVGTGVILRTEGQSVDTSRKLMQKFAAKILVCNDQFGENAIRALGPSVLNEIRYVIARSGSVSHEFQSFLTKRGVEVKESIGLPECSPVIAINSPDFTGKDIGGKKIVQEGTRKNRAGRPIPGIAVRVVNHLDYDNELMNDQVGLILIRGANVFRNYLNGFSYNLLSFYKGWYVTGLQGSLDGDGFLSLQSPS